MTDAAHPVDLLAEFALGVLPEAESGPVRLHLSACVSCSAEWQAMANVARLLPLAAEEFTPSASLKAGILQRIHEDRAPLPLVAVESPANVALFPRRRRWAWAGAAAASLAALLVTGGAMGFALRDDAPDPVVALQAEAVRAAAGGTLRVAHAETGGLRAAVVHARGSRTAYIQVDGLPAAPAGKAYQAWFSKDGASFEPSDLFADGAGAWAPAEGDLAQYVVVGITLEDDAGARTPTLPGVIFIDLTKSVALRLR